MVSPGRHTEDEKEYLIKAELPEIKKEDVKLTVQDNVLAISGERKYEKAEKGKKYHRVERAYGSFMRSFTLPEDADGSKVLGIPWSWSFDTRRRAFG